MLNYYLLNKKNLMIKFVLYFRIGFSFNHIHCLVSFMVTGLAISSSVSPIISSFIQLYNIYFNQIKLSVDDEAETKDNGGDKNKGMIMKDQKTINK